MTKNVHDVLCNLLEQRLVNYKNDSLNRQTCTMIYQDLFKTVQDVCVSSGIKLTNEGLNYLVQMYYDVIKVNGHQELDPNIFDKRTKLENMKTSEIAMLATFVNGTPLATPLINEIKKRS